MEKTMLNIKDIQSSKDIKYTDFQQFQSILNISEGEIDETVLSYKILSIFYGIKKDMARKLTPEQFELLLTKVYNAIEEKVEFHNLIIVNGTKYGFIPNFSKITAGELIDLDNLLKEDNFISIMSILYRPIVGDINKHGEYKIAEYEGFDDKFKDISLYQVRGAIDFFTKSFQILNHLTNTSTGNQK